jgi:hypothetical protein
MSALRPFLTPPFVVTSLLLVAAWAGLRPATDALVERFRKYPVDLRRPLDAFDVGSLPSFRVVAEGSPFATTITGAAGTPDAVKFAFEMRGSGTEGRRDRDVLLFVTYYSDPRDTIPHTPEVCYRQAGAIVRSMRTTAVSLPAEDGEGRQITARLLDMELRWHAALAYVFVANGEFYPSRNRVRLARGLSPAHHFYFSKVEAVTNVPRGEDFEDAVDRCTRLLSEALPVLVRDHYPEVESAREQS